MVHFLLAKCYLKSGRNPEATLAFTAARELNPKMEGAIRTVMRAGGEAMDEDEDEL